MMTKRIPLCHKCTHVVTNDLDGMKIMIGCTANSEIKTYAHAMVMCPVLKELEDENES
jgi:hypothetical protein